MMIPDPLVQPLAAVFMDVFLDKVAISLHTSYLLWPLFFFGHAGAQPLGVAAWLGGTGGLMANWGLGWLLAAFIHLPFLRGSGKMEANYQTLQSYVLRFGGFALLISWAPMFGILAVITGFFRLPWWQALLCITVSQLLYYAVIIQGALGQV